MAVAAACAPHHGPGWQAAFAAGDRAYSAGRMAEAARAFDHAAAVGVGARDRDEAVFLAAGAYLRAGETAPALARYDTLASAHPPGERAARSALEAAQIRRTGGDTTSADAGLEALVRGFPDTGPGRRALDILLEDLDRADPTHRRAMGLLDALARDLAGAHVLDAVLLLRARSLEAMADTAGAIGTYRRLLDTVPYPQNRHWDDGGLALARLLRGTGDPRGALAVIDRVLAVREPSWGNGDYEAPDFGELAMLRGRILRDDLHDLAGAARAFHFLYASFRNSRLRDDGLREEAVTRATAGDRAGACATYETLAREFPCTRPGREALAETAACGRNVPRTDPRTCR